MQNKLNLLFISILAFTLSGCEAIGTIFKAGMYWGFLVVALVVGLVIWLFTRNKNK